MKNFILGLSLFLFFACGNKNASNDSPVAVSSDFTAYSVNNIADTGLQKATKMDAAGAVLQEDGLIMDDKKLGSWNTYYQDGKIKTMTNYVNGMKNGFHLELNDRGQVSLHQNYLDDQLHGRQVKYAFGSRIEEETNYKNGQLDGVYKSYFRNKPGQVQKEVHYKNNLQHGKFIQYSEEGKVLLEYDYENGKKLSGGVKN